MNVNANRTKDAPVRKPVIWGVVIVVVLLLGYLVTWAPTHYARATATVADGSEAFEVGGGATVTPAEGWRVEPVVENLGFAPFKSWSVLFSDTGTEVLSPDRALAVEFFPDPAGEFDAALLEGDGAISETLASGAQIRHVDTDNRVIAVIEGVGDAPIFMQATVRGAELAEYRPAISAIVESVQ